MTDLELHPADFTGEAIVADASSKASSGKYTRMWLFLALGLAVVAMAAALVSTVKKGE